MVENNLIKITEYNPKGKKIYKEGDKVALSFDSKDVHIIPKTNVKEELEYID